MDQMELSRMISHQILPSLVSCQLHIFLEPFLGGICHSHSGPDPFGDPFEDRRVMTASPVEVEGWGLGVRFPLNDPVL